MSLIGMPVYQETQNNCDRTTLHGEPHHHTASVLPVPVVTNQIHCSLRDSFSLCDSTNNHSSSVAHCFNTTMLQRRGTFYSLALSCVCRDIIQKGKLSTQCKIQQ
jgi:hypothetical protein